MLSTRTCRALSLTAGLLALNALWVAPAGAAPPGRQATSASAHFVRIPDLDPNLVPHAHTDSEVSHENLVSHDPAVDVTLPGGVRLLGPQGILAVGAARQVALTPNGTSATAASGDVTDDGALAGSETGEIRLDMGGVIPTRLRTSVDDLGMTVGSIGATADLSGADRVGDYRIADLELSLNSPLVAEIGSELTARMHELQPKVDALGPALNTAMGGDVSVDRVPDLAVRMAQLTTVDAGGGAVVANLQTGDITVDVDALLAFSGRDLNDLLPNSELMPVLAAALSSALLASIEDTLQELSADISAEFATLPMAVAGTSVTIPTDVDAAVVVPVLGAALEPIATTTAGLTDDVLAPLSAALQGILGLRVNSQIAAEEFTQTALSLSLLPMDGEPLAQVELASATVGSRVDNAQSVPAPPTFVGPATAEVLGEAFEETTEPDMDCGDFPTWADANTWFLEHSGLGHDVAHLDADNDNIPCEALPGAPGAEPDSTELSATSENSSAEAEPADVVIAQALPAAARPGHQPGLAATGGGDLPSLLVAGSMLLAGGLLLLVTARRRPGRQR